MFENYTVTASRHPSSFPMCDDGLFGSGWDTPRTSPTSESFNRQMSITQLSQQFSELRYTSQTVSSVANHMSTIADNDLDSSLDSLDYVGAFSPSRRRTQRQHGVRMLCDPTHLRSIQDMVDRMVRVGDQCAVSPPRAVSAEPLPVQGDDEGYSSLDEDRRNGSISSVSSSGSTLSFRRSADSTTGACVSKNVRIKKARSPRSHPKQS